MLFRLQGALALTAALFSLALAGVSPASAQSDTTQGADPAANGEEKPAETEQAPVPEPDC